MELADAQRQLASIGRRIHIRGWVPATSGNLSIRLTDGDIAITASGRDKGQLVPDDIMCVSAEGTPRTGQRPSAETALHLQLYRRDPAINAVLHTHSVNATLVSVRTSAGLRFEQLEILKAFTGIHTHEAVIDIPVFANSQDIPSLADRVEHHMQANGQGVAYLIAGHGLYTWGATVDDCMRHLEALEYLLEYHRLNDAWKQRTMTSE